MRPNKAKAFAISALSAKRLRVGGDWRAAVAALDKSRELRLGGDPVDWLFLAMAHRKLGNHDEASKAYHQALECLEKNQEKLEKDKGLAQELRPFRAEAEEVLELKKK